MKIAVYGGSFNLPHIGHLKIANNIVSNFKPFCLLVIPNNFNPFKVKYHHSYDLPAMIDATFIDIPNTIIDWHEYYCQNNSYAIDFFKRLKAVYPSTAKFYFFIGSDLISKLAEWKDFKELKTLTKFLAIHRKNNDNFTKNILPENIYSDLVDDYLYWDIPAISSSYLRANADNHKILEEFLHPEAFKIFKNHCIDK